MSKLIALLLCPSLWGQPGPGQAPPGLTNLTTPGAGARVCAISSNYGTIWDRDYLLDGDLKTGWASEDGRVQGESFTVDLGSVREIRAVGICPSATGSSPVTNAALRSFEIRVSDATRSPGASRRLIKGPCKNRRELQVFSFAPTKARYVTLMVGSNFGYTRWVEVAEFAVFGPKLAGAEAAPRPPTPAAAAKPEQPALALPPARGLVLYDTAGWGAAADLKAFVADLESAGFEVRPVAAGPAGRAPLGAVDFGPARVVVVHLRESFSPEEIAALTGFAWAGGGLLVSIKAASGKSDFLAGANELLAHFDATVSEAQGSGPATYVNPNQPVTAGLTGLEVGKESVAIWTRRLTRLAQVGREVCAASGSYGSGRVAVVTADLIEDPGPATANIKSADNAEFAVRLMRWLANAPPQQ